MKLLSRPSKGNACSHQNACSHSVAHLDSSSATEDSVPDVAPTWVVFNLLVPTTGSTKQEELPCVCSSFYTFHEKWHFTFWCSGSQLQQRPRAGMQAAGSQYMHGRKTLPERVTKMSVYGSNHNFNCCFWKFVGSYLLLWSFGDVIQRWIEIALWTTLQVLPSRVI